MEDIADSGSAEMFHQPGQPQETNYDPVTQYRQSLAVEAFDDSLIPYSSDLDMLTPPQPVPDQEITDSESPTSITSSAVGIKPDVVASDTSQERGARSKTSASKRRGRSKKSTRADSKMSAALPVTPEQMTENLKLSVEAVKAIVPILIKTRALKEPLPDGTMPSLYKYGIVTDAFLSDPQLQQVPGETQQRLDFVVEVDTVSHKCTRDALSALGVTSVYRSFWNDCRVYAELGATTRWYPLHEWLTTRVRTGAEVIPATVLRQPDEIPKDLTEDVKAHLAALPLGSNRRKEAGPRRRSPDLAAVEAARLATQPAPRPRKRPSMTPSDDEFEEPYEMYLPQPAQPRPLKQPKLMPQHELLPIYEGMIPLTMSGIVLHPVAEGHPFMHMHMGGVPMAMPMHFQFQQPQHVPDHPHLNHHVAAWHDGGMQL